MESPGYSPNADQERGGVVRTVFITTTTICVATLILRYYTQWFIVRRFGADDVFITLAVVSASSLNAQKLH